MTHKYTMTVLAAITLTTAAICLSGCGGGDGDDEPQPAGTEQTPTAENVDPDTDTDDASSDVGVDSDAVGRADVDTEVDGFADGAAERDADLQADADAATEDELTADAEDVDQTAAGAADDDQPLPGEAVDGEPQETASGVKYWILQEGDGASAEDVTDMVTVHYSLYLRDGTKVQSSRDFNQPFTQQLSGLIPGWQEGVMGMREGEHRKLVIPPDLAYGETGRPGIPANSTLVFDLELLEVSNYRTLPPIAELPGWEVTEEPQQTDAGLEYWIVEEGEGESPSDVDTLVEYAYSAYLADGTLFAGTPDNRPEVNAADAILPALSEQIVQMQEGERRKIIVPPDLGYGDRGLARRVPPGAVLIYDIELIKITGTEDLPGWEVTGEPQMTEDGAEYWVLEEGDGESPPSRFSFIEHQFVVYLANGTVISDSYEQGGPARTTVMQNLPVLADALMQMNEGGKRKMVIPPDLAFGAAGSQQSRVPPNSTLVIDLELVNVPEPPVVEIPEELPGETVDGEPTRTATGLAYFDIKEGDGPSPGEGDFARVHYTGWLTDGTKFDSSRDRGEPITFSLRGGVIAGWLEGVRSMNVGGKRKLVIPSELGYGERGSQSGNIPPNATLIFDIELLEVTDQPPPRRMPLGHGG